MKLDFKNIVNDLQFGNIIDRLMAEKQLKLDEARHELSKMSFIQYRMFLENITPPSGNTIGPSTTNQPAAPQSTSKSNIKSLWPGKGSPLEVGMTVGLKGPNNLPVPGEITQVDMSAKGVKVKNPTTGQSEWQSIDNLEAYVNQQNSNNTTSQTPQVTNEEELRRLKKLAGINETASSGATSAGSIAASPVTAGKVLKRTQYTDEALKKEYNRKEPPKSIIGDTKPNQASGELSANLAASGKKVASRTNNGFKK